MCRAQFGIERFGRLEGPLAAGARSGGLRRDFKAALRANGVTLSIGEGVLAFP